MRHGQVQLTERAGPSRGAGARDAGARGALACVLLAAALACDRGAPAPASPPVLGQWLWSARDSALLASARATYPAMRAGVWVATIARRGDSLVTSLGRPLDRSVGADAEVVIRIDDSFSALWSTASGEELAGRLGTRIARVLAVAERGGGARAVQLDYDAPVARLAEYASLVRSLRAPTGVLHGRALWVTSLVAHLADPDYGALFRPLVDGHIIQLFDTGDRYVPRRAGEVLARVERAGLPFRVGVGAFERRLTSGNTTHRAWFAFLPVAARSRWYRGAWIFPGGEAYLPYLPH